VDIQYDGFFIREFKKVSEEDLVWHRDHNDREFEVLRGAGWQIQFDNKLPVELKNKKTYFVPKMVYHRLIKGKGDLKIKIWEQTNEN
jgi:hypothetical protein